MYNGQINVYGDEIEIQNLRKMDLMYKASLKTKEYILSL